MVCSGAREEAAVEKDPEPEGAAWRRRWQPRGKRGGGGGADEKERGRGKGGAGDPVRPWGQRSLGGGVQWQLHKVRYNLALTGVSTINSIISNDTNVNLVYIISSDDIC